MPVTNRNNSRQTFSRAQSGMDPDQAAADDVELSTRSMQDTDLKLATIAMLQRKIADGTYGIPAGAVAEKIVERLLHPAEAGPSDVRLGRYPVKDVQ